MDASFSLRFGLPGQEVLLHLDVLSMFFGTLLLPQIAASALAGMKRAAWFWLFSFGLVFTVAAASPFALIFGVGLTGAALWCLAVQENISQGIAYAKITAFAVTCFIPAFALPVSSLAFVLVVLGTTTLAGLVPFYNGFPRLYVALPEAMSGLMSGGAVTIALYILVRYAFITAAGSQLSWWGVLLMVIGALSVGRGALKAALAIDLRDVLSWSTVAATGLIVIGIGVALWAKALGDVVLSGLALQAVLLGILAHGLFKPLLFLGAGEVRRAVGTSSLNWLGGLMRGMPRLGALMLLGAAGMAALPLGPEFASIFLLIHALVAMAFHGGSVACLSCAFLLAIVGSGMALLLLASIKLIGLGFLGRPRSLHAAAAEDARRGPLWGMTLLGGLSLPVALVPGFILLLCMPVVHAMAPLAQTMALTYAPLTLCLLGGGALLALGFIQASKGERKLHETPTWNGGFFCPPSWLPFGDPQTQPSAGGLAESMQVAFGLSVASSWWERRFLPLRRLCARTVWGVLHSRFPAPRLGLALAFVVMALVMLGLSLVWAR